MTEDFSKEFDFLEADDCGGFSDLNADVMTMPFLRVIQSLSPQCKKSSPEYIAGAEEGMIFNTISRKLYTPPLEIVVGRFDRYFIEWKPNRGGFVAAHLAHDVQKAVATGKLQRDGARIINPENGNQLADTYTYYVLMPQHIQDGVCLLCLSSTQLKEARRWNYLLSNTFLPGTMKKAEPYHMVWTLSTPIQTNEKGEWAGIKAEFSRFVTREVLSLVKTERQALAQIMPDMQAIGEFDQEDSQNFTPRNDDVPF